MNASLVHRVALPAIMTAVIGLTACQSSSINTRTSGSFASTTQTANTNELSSREVAKKWRVRVQERRQTFIAKLQERREKRQAFRVKLKEKRLAYRLNAGKEKASFNYASLRDEVFYASIRDDAGTTPSWGAYKRRDNKPFRTSKKAEGPKIAKAPAKSVKKKTVAKATPKTVKKKTVAKAPAPKKTSSGSYGNLIAKYAKQHGVPVHLARAVVQVESSFRADVTGAAGEVGLMQIKLATARGMGYKGSRQELYNPATNLYWGMKYLGRAYQLAGGTTCGTILKYNAGHGAKKMNRISSRYCGRVKRIIA